LVLGSAAGAPAQSAAQNPAQSAQNTAQGNTRANAASPAAEAIPHQNGDADAIDVSRLGVDVERIQRQLRQTTVREEIDGLHLRYTIDVYGRAPNIELFTREDNLQKGPVPYGAPTHSDILQAITPQEYRAPAADFGALFRWLADKAKDKK
jgi:hypothetical protein